MMQQFSQKYSMKGAVLVLGVFLQPQSLVTKKYSIFKQSSLLDLNQEVK